MAVGILSIALIVIFLSLPVFFRLPQAIVKYFCCVWYLHLVPGWRTHWFWGSLDQMKPDEKTLLEVTAWIHENKLRISKGWLGPFYPVVGVYHPDVFAAIMKEPKHDLIYNLLGPWLGDGLLISKGCKWLRNGRLLTPAFHYEILTFPFTTTV